MIRVAYPQLEGELPLEILNENKCVLRKKIEIIVNVKWSNFTKN